MLHPQKESPNSPHILNTSANLLGLCFILLTTIGLLHVKSRTYLDEITLLAMILFMASTIASFLSMKTMNGLSVRLETIAEYIFLTGLLVLFATALLIAFNLINI